MSRVIRYLAVAVVVAIGQGAPSGAEIILRWQTPDGRTYFGQNPPRGSIAVNEVEDIGHAGSLHVTAAEEIPAEAEFEIARRATRTSAAKSREPTTSPRGLPVDFIGQPATTVRRGRREVTFCVKNYGEEERAVTVQRGTDAYEIGMVGAKAVRCVTRETPVLGAEMLISTSD